MKNLPVIGEICGFLRLCVFALVSLAVFGALLLLFVLFCFSELILPHEANEENSAARS